ncbi:recombinase family protein [Vibrio diabolicus]|nr:recombinase family protein [Vibrio alginolyticus]MCS0338008.1 recombinase family protein [Vibrio diabolicus]
MSSHAQKEKGDSLDGQRQSIEEWAERNGHEIVKWYKDEAASAFKGKRFVFDLMLNEISERIINADGVVVYSLSRFSRNLKNQLTAMEVLEKVGLVLQSVSESLPNDPTSFRFMTNMLGMLHEHQSRENSAVVSDRLRDTANKGFHTGGPRTFGYKSIPVEGDASKHRKQLVIVSDEAEVVKLIYSLSDKGHNGKGLGVKAIAQYLNSKKITNDGKVWNSKVIHKILTNTIYIGNKVFGKTKKADHRRSLLSSKSLQLFRKNYFQELNGS